MRSMFQVGFEKEIFSERHPEMGISFNELQNWWKANYPTIKQNLKPLTTQQLPAGTVPIVPATAPRYVAPAPSSGASTALVLGGLSAAALAAYYFLAKRPFGIRK